MRLPCRYQKQLANCSPVRLIDLSDVNKQVSVHRHL